ncbi:hypothetical protein SK128_021011 [Halocaridina rubra]|uniref:Uncharacterized protein n=1 Tax=Halocaridina rubra TaxID=373956 RepID=A0AAN9ADS6_HALRR
MEQAQLLTCYIICIILYSLATYQISIKSLNRTLQAPGNKTQNEREIWSPVLLSFSPKFQLTLKTGEVLLNDDNPIEDLQEQQRTLRVNNAEILTNCPQEEPVWHMKSMKTKTFPLETNDSFVIIPKQIPMKVTISINDKQQYLYAKNDSLCTQPELQDSCCFEERNEYKLSFKLLHDQLKYESLGQREKRQPSYPKG